MSEVGQASVNVDENLAIADIAQKTANDANAKNSANSQQIANINNPNYLTPFEKPQLEIQMDNFATIYKTDKDIAAAEGIDFTSYDAAYQAYLAYMKPLTADITTYSPIVRTTFNSLVVAVQNAQKAFNAATQAQYTQAMDKAKDDIAKGQSSYAAMQQAVADMKSNANSVATTASAAISKAGFANDTASTASQAANDAKTIASQAVNNVAIAKNDAANALTNAMSAQNAASSAAAVASSTASEFGKVSQKADSAVASAVNAQNAASDAVKQASSAAADSKDAKQIAGAVSQSYKTLTDGSTMTIAELQSGLAVKLTKTDLNGYATQDWSQNQIKLTSDGINGTMSSIKSTVDSHTTSINDIQADSRGFKAQFTTYKDTVDKHDRDISTIQADAKSLSSNFDSLNTANGTNEHNISELKQTATEVSTTLETVKTQVQDSAVGINLAIGTNQEYAMGYGIPNTSWTDGYAYLKLPTNVINGEILPQNPHTFWYTLTQGVTYTQTIWFETDATVKDLSAAQITWYTGAGHDYQPARVQKLGQNSYKAVSTYTWPDKSDNNVRLFDIQHLDSAFDLSTGTYLKFGKLKLEKGSLSTDYSVNPEDTATVTAVSKISQTVDGMQTDISKKIEGKDLNGYATETWTNGQIKTTADGINGTLSKKIEKTDLNGYATEDWAQNQIKITAEGIQTTVSDKVSSSQLTQLSNQLTNKISDLSSSTSSQFTQTSKDINGLVKKGDVVNQFNLDAGGALLSTSGNSTKIVFSSPNIIFDSANPVQIPNVNIPGLLTGKTIETGTITATTKIKGSDIEAPLIHSPSGSFKLDGNTGDIIGASIGAKDNSWSISKAGKVTGTSITASVMDISGDGGGPDFDNIDNNGVTPDTVEGIYSRYKYTVDAGYDTGGMHRKLYKNGFLVINGDTFLDRTIGDWSADGGGKYVYDTMYEAHSIKMRAYNYTGSSVQTDDPTKTQGSLSDRLDITPKAITMGTNWSTDSPATRITSAGAAKFGNFYFNSGHTMQSMDGGAIYLESQNNGMVDLHVQKLYQSSLLSLKTDITDIDPHDALKTIVGTDVKSYHFKTDDTNEPKSVSPILDDINPIPKYNTPDIFKSADGKSRSDGNIVGYLMLSIKDLNNRLQKLEGAN